MSLSAGRGRRAIVSGMVAGVPGQGGATWAVLQYVLGLRELGWDVWLIESVPDEDLTPAVRRYFADVCARFDLSGRASLITPGGACVGCSRTELVAAARGAAVHLNLAGTLRDPDLVDPIPVRIYVDLDPGFTQLWQAAEGIDMGLGGHTHFASVGLDVGTPDSPVPGLDLPWIPTLPPVVLSHWRTERDVERDAWTTVGNWRAYGSIAYRGRSYGQKAHAFRALIDLPRRTDERFEIALSIHPDETADLAALRDNGWTLIDPAEVAATPDDYRRFVAGSLAELGIAKSGYVEAKCGWFSDRSAAYLACGRPVLAQDTGFSRHLPSGLGLLSFTGPDEVAAGVASVRADYARHARAAREIAEGYLDSRLVLGRLLERAGAA